MSGRRAQGPTPRASLEELVRLACHTDPAQPPSRPRRAALVPRAALALGVCLIVLALVLAARTMLTAPAGRTGSSQAEKGPEQQIQASVPASATASAPGGLNLAPADPASPGAGPRQLVVHVAGAVAAPGVVVLQPGARVANAIDAAGGATADADTDQLNLARPLSDGEQVRVPRAGEDVSTWAQQPAGAGAGRAGTTAGGQTGEQQAGSPDHQADGLINLNTAEAAALENLPGIGPALAERIVSHREAHGPFTAVEDLLNVPGIGRAKLEALRERATV
ncbi:helix-hairpin-helix domain-containing protein [Actinomyces faecalis]|uniref:helix-hairpin-helix domain-containing protein n=1 Tax=Actinomyces faecalis TaxID=2722820 RepID=UPI001553F697|nr:helix-hairpin-helix domain-containing protein [Actinomyces faecalis]